MGKKKSIWQRIFKKKKKIYALGFYDHSQGITSSTSLAASEKLALLQAVPW